MREILDDARRAARTGVLILGAGLAVSMAAVAAGLSWVAGRYSRATSAPSAQPSTRAEREVRKAIRRSFIAAGLGEHDLKALREDVKWENDRVRWWRHEAIFAPNRERALRIARNGARVAHARYAAACAAAGAVPRGAR